VAWLGIVLAVLDWGWGRLGSILFGVGQDTIYYGYPADYSTTILRQQLVFHPPENYPSSDTGAPPDDQSPMQSTDAGKNRDAVLLYMKDRSVFAASDYWVEDGNCTTYSRPAPKKCGAGPSGHKTHDGRKCDLGTQVTLKPRPANSDVAQNSFANCSYGQAAEQPDLTATTRS